MILPPAVQTLTLQSVFTSSTSRPVETTRHLWSTFDETLFMQGTLPLVFSMLNSRTAGSLHLIYDSCHPGVREKCQPSHFAVINALVWRWETGNGEFIFFRFLSVRSTLRIPRHRWFDFLSYFHTCLELKSSASRWIRL